MSPDRPVDADGFSKKQHVSARLPPPAALYCHRAHRSCARRMSSSAWLQAATCCQGRWGPRPRALDAGRSTSPGHSHRCVRRHGQHVLLTQTRQATTKPRRSSHLVVTRNASMRQRGTLFLQHLQGQLVTRTIGPGRFGHARFVRAPPYPWSILLADTAKDVDQGVPLAGDIAQGDGYLAVIDFAQTATPLTGYAHRLPTGLGKPRRIEHQHPIALSQVRLDLAPQLLAQGGIVPRVPPNEALQREASWPKQFQAIDSMFLRSTFDSRPHT